MTQRDLAEMYLKKGGDDQLIAERLAPMGDIPDSGVGFHGQQAVEKYLKAVLALNEVPVRRTHDIGALLGQLAELGVELPDGLDAALELTPYSVLERYPMAREAEALDRKRLLGIVSHVRAWAEGVIAQG